MAVKNDIEFRTVVELPKGLPAITHEGRVLMLGSCFAENVGALLAARKFRLDMNPFGILYNPMSVSEALKSITSGYKYTETDLFFYKESWHSPMHHGSFSGSTKETTLHAINTRLSSAHQAYPDLDWLILTWGTAYVYEQKKSGKVVGNCHKLPDEEFIRRRLTVEEIVDEYTSLLTRMIVRNDRLKILFTVSPIRHIRDGMPDNQLSKATLLLAVEHLKQLFPGKVFYFPSYEIVMDELRDYRFYADDMLHPSALAIHYLWQRFSEVFFSSGTKELMAEVEEIERDLAHKPFHPESEAYQSFLEQIVFKIERLGKKCPYLEFQKEIELCHMRLKL